MDDIVVVTPSETKEEATTLRPSSPTSFSKKLPVCRRETPSTLVSSWMTSRDNNGYKPYQPRRPSMEDRSDSSRNNCNPLEHRLHRRRQNRSILESHTAAIKRDNTKRRSRSTDQLFDMSGDEDSPKDIHSSAAPPPLPDESRPTSTSFCSWEEDGEMLVDFYLKIPSQTSIQRRTRSDLRQRYQPPGRTRRLGSVQNLFTTSGKSKSMP